MSNKYTSAALIEFCENLELTGISHRQANTLATACREVLSIEPSPDYDIRTVSVETFLQRFAAERPQYRPQTLAAYKSRFRKAVDWYLEYTDDPSWTPDQPKTSRKPLARLQRYEFPLRPDLFVTIDLPRDMTASEAERLSAFTRSLGL